MATKNRGLVVRIGLLRDSVREIMFPGDIALRDKGNDTKDTVAPRTTAAGDYPNATTVLASDTGSH